MTWHDEPLPKWSPGAEHTSHGWTLVNSPKKKDRKVSFYVFGGRILLTLDVFLLRCNSLALPVNQLRQEAESRKHGVGEWWVAPILKKCHLEMVGKPPIYE
jgi:hypothetical protein